MNLKIKTIILLVFVVTVALFVTACNDNTNTIEPTPFSTVALRTSNITTAPSAEPTIAPTAIPTIQPGQRTYADGIKNDEPLDIYYFDDTQENGVLVLEESIAVQFFPTSEVNNIYISCPSLNDDTGTLQFDVYPWQGTYLSTVSADSIFTKTFENYKDNTLIKLEFEDSLPDGEYIILITSPDPEEGVGVWVKLTEFEGQRVYANDILVEDRSIQMQITYANTPNNIIGTISEKYE